MLHNELDNLTNEQLKEMLKVSWETIRRLNRREQKSTHFANKWRRRYASCKNPAQEWEKRALEQYRDARGLYKEIRKDYITNDLKYYLKLFIRKFCTRLYTFFRLWDK